jgi:hypothetical protein
MLETGSGTAISTANSASLASTLSGVNCRVEWAIRIAGVNLADTICGGIGVTLIGFQEVVRCGDWSRLAK